jgi:nitroimidazol reductase NimA-like FMN-containing flavoprotein (pyridoxamine 5'-phosphate oxidase superfamily)
MDMREIRRKDKVITDEDEMKEPLKKAKYVTEAMSCDDEPYLVTLSHGYDDFLNCIYFHCAREGKKIDILNTNNLVWGQALLDGGYQQGHCDHLYHTTLFRGKVTFIEDVREKERALLLMIRQVDDNPDKIIAEQITSESIKRVHIGRIDIEYMSGKKADRIIISL